MFLVSFITASEHDLELRFTLGWKHHEPAYWKWSLALLASWRTGLNLSYNLSANSYRSCLVPTWNLSVMKLHASPYSTFTNYIQGHTRYSLTIPPKKSVYNRTKQTYTSIQLSHISIGSAANGRGLWICLRRPWTGGTGKLKKMEGNYT